MDFSGTDVQSIEAALEQHRPGGWRRLTEEALKQCPTVTARAAWQLTVPVGQFACAAVDRMWLLLDHDFPWSELRIAIPALKLGAWPHVEPHGLLCLTRTRWSASAGDRAIETIAAACEVLDFDETRRKAEFSREFFAYWDQLLPDQARPLYIAPTTPDGRSREIVFGRVRNGAHVVLADDRNMLLRWLEHSGEKIEAQDVRKTRLIWLADPWMPAEFPERVQDVLNQAERGAFNSYLKMGESLPVLFGATTATGPVLVGVDVPGGTTQQFKKGFRPNHVPGIAIATFTGSKPVLRCRVERADAAWVHGRGHDEMQAILAGKQVGIVGCGSLGGAVARMLAQMGIGNFVLVDSDALSSANTSRHILGAGFVGQNKAVAVGRMLLRDFPHLIKVECFEKLFQKLPDANLARLAECDLIVSAGLDATSDAILDQWRRALGKPPVHICTWVEEFAVVGHAVALFAEDSLIAGLTEDGIPIFCMTEWPDTVQTKITEAGCGNSFQPHGAIDLSNSVSLAAKLVLDVLMDDVKKSCRRTWLGDRDHLVRLGGRPLAEFNVSNTIKAFTWPHGESPRESWRLFGLS